MRTNHREKHAFRQRRNYTPDDDDLFQLVLLRLCAGFEPAEAEVGGLIVADKRDLCLQIFGGDHYNVFARSSVIRVPFKGIEKAAHAAGDWVVRPKRR